MHAIAVRRAIEAIPGLRTYLRELHDLSARMAAGVQFAPDDHFAFMAIFFHAKQLEHTEGVLALNGHPDASLIARSMLEGMWQLIWAYHDPRDRAHRWRAFSIVYDWRLMQERIAAGTPVDPEKQASIAARLQPVRQLFLTRRAQQCERDGLPLPADPFVPTWSGKQIRQLAEESGGLELYITVYEEVSERHHWDPAGIAPGIQRDGARLGYSSRSASAEATALAAAFQCLYEMSRVLDSYLSLGFADRLVEIETRYVASDARVRVLHPDTGSNIASSVG